MHKEQRMFMPKDTPCIFVGPNGLAKLNKATAAEIAAFANEPGNSQSSGRKNRNGDLYPASCLIDVVYTTKNVAEQNEVIPRKHATIDVWEKRNATEGSPSHYTLIDVPVTAQMAKWCDKYGHLVLVTRDDEGRQALKAQTEQEAAPRGHAG